jgi:HlyD family secretion protein
MKKIIIIAVVVIAAAVGAYFLFGSSKEKKDGIKVVEVKKGNIVQKALAIGRLDPIQEIQVKSKISGIVKKLHVEIGNKVKAGDPLLTVAPNPTPIEYAEAKRGVELCQVDYDNAQKVFQRSQEMFKKNLISQQDFDINKVEVSQYELKLQLARERLELLQKGVTPDGRNENTIISPIDGTVLERLVSEGDPVVPLTSYQAGTPLLSLAPMEQIVFKGTVDEIDVGKLKDGMAADIKVGALPNDKLKGKLLRISPKARKQDNTTLFDIEITIDSSGADVLRAGYSANAEIVISKRDSVLVIPERLVTFAGDSSKVELQDSTGKIESKPIKVGLSDGLNIEITEGVALGDKIVERPPKEIK